MLTAAFKMLAAGKMAAFGEPEFGDGKLGVAGVRQIPESLVVFDVFVDLRDGSVADVATEDELNRAQVRWRSLIHD